MRHARSTAAAAALLLSATFSVQAQSPELEAVASVDLARYVGTWYEQAHLPLFFQRNCVANTTARYALREDGRIDVVNQCDDKDGKRIEATAIARRVGESTSKLEVRFAPAFLSFLPAVWGDYWILDPGPRVPPGHRRLAGPEVPVVPHPRTGVSRGGAGRADRQGEGHGIRDCQADPDGAALKGAGGAGSCGIRGRGSGERRPRCPATTGEAAAGLAAGP